MLLFSGVLNNQSSINLPLLLLLARLLLGKLLLPLHWRSILVQPSFQPIQGNVTGR